MNDSVADKAGMAVEDEILSIDDKTIEMTLNDHLSRDTKEVTFQLKRRFENKNVTLQAGSYFLLQQLNKASASDELKLLRKVWRKSN